MTVHIQPTYLVNRCRHSKHFLPHVPMTTPYLGLGPAFLKTSCNISNRYKNLSRSTLYYFVYAATT